MQLQFDENERRYFFKLLMLKASMEQDRKASRFWVDLAEQFASNRAVSLLKPVHLSLLLDIINKVCDTIIKETASGSIPDSKKAVFENITTLLRAAETKITQKLSNINQGEANGT